MKGEPGERRHGAGYVGDDHDLRLGRPREPELGFGGYTPVAERVADRVAEVEGPLSAVTTLSGEAYGQLPGQRVDGLLQVSHLLAGGVHEIDILGQRLSKRPRHCLHAAVGHQAAPDLGFDLLLELFYAVAELVSFEALLERG